MPIAFSLARIILTNGSDGDKLNETRPERYHDDVMTIGSLSGMIICHG
jgi:hypothetical protein